MLLSLAVIDSAFASDINGLRFWQDPEKTRIVFDLSEKVDYKLFTLPNPSRLVVDINQSNLKADINAIKLPEALVGSIRTSHKKGNTRVVIDLKKSVTTKDFTLKPYQKYGHRLVIDLVPKDSRKKIVKKAEDRNTNQKRDIIIAIDAGHGGEDPGAPGGEKEVCLAVAKKLAALINKEKGMKAVLTRKDDYFVGLLKRTEIARSNKADLFISLHADGFSDKRVRGTSVWVLSPRGATSEMGRWLEQKENASDLAGGVDISNQDPLVAAVLLDLSMNYSVGESLKAAGLVRKQLSGNMPKMHGKGIKKAAFVVLQMPDIPAMLVEMGFISNKKENKQLKSAKHQRKIASSVLKGVKTYFKQNPPDGTLYAGLHKRKNSQTKVASVSKSNTQKTVKPSVKKAVKKSVKAKNKSHKVKSGDTLSEIALRHGISTSKLRKHNRLRNDHIRIGQIIKIPGA
ncbi:MAG: N-acetylmuramoyl-L-alanine amidase [Kangiellaceae bacterium]|nr:N-acetylmuramoyl-L-alanine amidase [Kangiellaceae bacterium]